MKQISQIEWAYIAGLFEGEGSVRFQNRSIQIEISMTDREPLDRVAESLGGNVRGPFPRSNPNWTPIYRLALASKSTIDLVYENIQDWLSPRKLAQFELAYKKYKIKKESQV